LDTILTFHFAPRVPNVFIYREGAEYIVGTRNNTMIQSQSQSYVTTDGQSASLSWCQAPIWGLLLRSLLLSDSCGFVDVGLSH
jgi:hypothetical protein